VTVEDTEAPTLSNGPVAGLVEDFFLPADEASVVNYLEPVANDNCPDPTVDFLSGLGNGSEFPTGISKEAYRATDASGNQLDACFNVGLLPFIQDFPYVEDFENGEGGFAAGTPGCATINSWEFGTPAGTVIQGAASGNNAWATGLSTPYADNEQSFIVSPFFLIDGVSLEKPSLS
ncbi:MAG: HYR domain-containing protein, partial [Bacteroidota bacterium]